MITLDEAIGYMNYGVKEGYFDIEDFKGLSNEELIQKVEELMDGGDAQADAQRKGE